MNKLCLLFLVFLVSSSLALDSKPSRIFKERVRSGSTDAPTTASPDDHHADEDDERPTPVRNSNVMGSMDTMASLARVQRDQAETFRLWASQFKEFKINVMKFMEQTSDVLQKNEKKIATLQRVVRKIANDMDE